MKRLFKSLRLHILLYMRPDGGLFGTLPYAYAAYYIEALPEGGTMVTLRWRRAAGASR